MTWWSHPHVYNWSVTGCHDIPRIKSLWRVSSYLKWKCEYVDNRGGQNFQSILASRLCRIIIDLLTLHLASNKNYPPPRPLICMYHHRQKINLAALKKILYCVFVYQLFVEVSHFHRRSLCQIVWFVLIDFQPTDDIHY